MFARRLLLAAALLPFMAGAAEPTPAQKFQFNDPNHRDTVTFVLDAPLEVINGLSNEVKGAVTVQGQRASGKFLVPVSSLRTGNDTRDEHLRDERWLDAAKFPNIVLEFKDLELPATLEAGKPLVLKTKGRFTIHGVTREEPLEVTALLLKESAETKNRAEGDLLRVRAKFKIPLEAYGIKRTQALVLKVGEAAEVAIDSWGSTRFQQPTL